MSMNDDDMDSDQWEKVVLLQGGSPLKNNNILEKSNPFDTPTFNTNPPRTSSPAVPINSNPSSITSNNNNNISLNSLNEPVSATLKRDLQMVWRKIMIVLIPRDRDPQSTIKHLQDWDLWGPLIICLFISILLSLSAPTSEQAELVFTAVFVIVWVGSAVLTINAQLLGAKISFFQSVSLIGYCLFPLAVCALIIVVVPFNNKVFHFIVLLIGFIWATRASVIFIAGCINEKKRALAVYPVFLFYIMISWMIFLQ